MLLKVPADKHLRTVWIKFTHLANVWRRLVEGQHLHKQILSWDKYTPAENEMQMLTIAVQLVDVSHPGL